MDGRFPAQPLVFVFVLEMFCWSDGMGSANGQCVEGKFAHRFMHFCWVNVDHFPICPKIFPSCQNCSFFLSSVLPLLPLMICRLSVSPVGRNHLYRGTVETIAPATVTIPLGIKINLRVIL